MEIMIRASVIFFFMWFLTRALGKRELSGMTAFELILMVTIGDLVQQGVTQEDMSLTGAGLAVGTIALWILIFSLLDYRFHRARKLIDGMPVVVVQDGHVLDDVLRCERLPLDDLLGAARNQGVGDLADVRLAVFEPEGKFSFFLYDGDKHLNPAQGSAVI